MQKMVPIKKKRRKKRLAGVRKKVSRKQKTLESSSNPFEKTFQKVFEKTSSKSNEETNPNLPEEITSNPIEKTFQKIFDETSSKNFEENSNLEPPKEDDSLQHNESAKQTLRVRPLAELEEPSKTQTDTLLPNPLSKPKTASNSAIVDKLDEQLDYCLTSTGVKLIFPEKTLKNVIVVKKPSSINPHIPMKGKIFTSESPSEIQSSIPETQSSIPETQQSSENLQTSTHSQIIPAEEETIAVTDPLNPQSSKNQKTYSRPQIQSEKPTSTMEKNLTAKPVFTSPTHGRMVTCSVIKDKCTLQDPLALQKKIFKAQTTSKTSQSESSLLTPTIPKKVETQFGWIKNGKFVVSNIAKPRSSNFNTRSVLKNAQTKKPSQMLNKPPTSEMQASSSTQRVSTKEEMPILNDPSELQFLDLKPTPATEATSSTPKASTEESNFQSSDFITAAENQPVSTKQELELTGQETKEVGLKDPSELQSSDSIIQPRNLQSSRSSQRIRKQTSKMEAISASQKASARKEKLNLTDSYEHSRSRKLNNPAKKKMVSKRQKNEKKNPYSKNPFGNECVFTLVPVPTNLQTSTLQGTSSMQNASTRREILINPFNSSIQPGMLQPVSKEQEIMITKIISIEEDVFAANDPSEHESLTNLKSSTSQILNKSSTSAVPEISITHEASEGEEKFTPKNMKTSRGLKRKRVTTKNEQMMAEEAPIKEEMYFSSDPSKLQSSISTIASTNFQTSTSSQMPYKSPSSSEDEIPLTDLASIEEQLVPQNSSELQNLVSIEESLLTELEIANMSSDFKKNSDVEFSFSEQESFPSEDEFSFSEDDSFYSEYYSLMLSQPEIYNCVHCKKTFTSEPDMVDHINSFKRVCDPCKKVFPSILKLKAHLKEVHKIKGYKCSNCNFFGVSLWDLKVHKFCDHCQEYMHSCKKCDKAFQSSEALELHISQLHDQPFQMTFLCDVCGRGLKNSYLLQHHIEYAHQDIKYPCNQCDEIMLTKMSLIRHKRTHNTKEKKVCEHCGKQFFIQSDLNLHVRQHTGEKPFTCKICSKGFAKRNTLRQHLLIHSGKRPYECDICGKSFTQKPGLTAHRKSHPGDLPPMPRFFIDKILKDLPEDAFRIENTLVRKFKVGLVDEADKNEESEDNPEEKETEEKNEEKGQKEEEKKEEEDPRTKNETMTGEEKAEEKGTEVKNEEEGQKKKKKKKEGKGLNTKNEKMTEEEGADPL